MRGNGSGTKSVDAIYEKGILRLRRKLPLRERAHVTVMLIKPENPVSRTHGIIRVSPRTARAIIYGDEADFYGA